MNGLQPPIVGELLAVLHGLQRFEQRRGRLVYREAPAELGSEHDGRGKACPRGDLQKRERRGGDMHVFGDLNCGAKGEVAAPDARVNDA